MLTMFPGKRQWQRVGDTAACEKRQREDDENDKVITDKTRLLSSESSETPSFYENFSDVCTYLHVDQAQEDELLSQITWKHDRASIEPWFSSVELSDFDHFNHAHKVESACPMRKPCSHASWQGFKQLVKKQFMPPFPFGKDMPPHLRQRRIEGAMNKTSRVLGANTNLVELRKLDAKIQNGMNKSAFVAGSTKGGKYKENMSRGHDQNIEISKAVKPSSLSETSLTVGINARVIKMKASKNGAPPSSLVKENGILRKLKRGMKKENVLLLANASANSARD